MSVCTGFDITNTFADLLHEVNCVAIPQSNGVLCDTVQALSPQIDLCGPTGDPSLTDQQVLESVGYMIQQVLMDEIPIAGNMFQSEINSLAEDVGTKAAAHIKAARTVVAPLVMALAKRYSEYLDVAKPKDPVAEFSIINVKPSMVLSDEFLIQELKYVNGRNVPFPDVSDFTTPMEALGFDQLVEMLMNTNSVASQSVKEWVLTKPSGWLESLWISSFVGLNQCRGQGYIGQIYFPDLVPAEGADAALAIYLWAKHLIDNDTAMAEGRNTRKRMSDLSQVMDYAASMLLGCIQRIALANSSRTLVLNYNSTTRTVFVNGDLYNTWLEAGGSPEVILGMLCSGSIIENMNVITERAQEFLAVWAQFSMVYSTKEINNRHMYSRSALVGFFNENLNTHVEAEKDVRQRESYFAQTRLQRARDYLEGLTIDQLEDVNTVCTYLVAKIRFDYTSAYEILKDMEDAHRANPEIDPREASLLATINYLGDFIAMNITLKRF